MRVSSLVVAAMALFTFGVPGKRRQTSIKCQKLCWYKQKCSFLFSYFNAFRTETELGVIDDAHDNMIWSLAWHPLGHILVSGGNDFTT